MLRYNKKISKKI